MIQGGEDPYDALVATHFRKRATNYRVLLRKMTYGDKTSYRFSVPYLYRLFSAEEPYN